jgi:hypothetical protein
MKSALCATGRTMGKTSRVHPRFGVVQTKTSASHRPALTTDHLARHILSGSLMSDRRIQEKCAVRSNQSIERKASGTPRVPSASAHLQR